MLLQSERMSEMHFPSIWRPEFQKVFLRCPPWDTSWRNWTKQIVKELNLWGKTAVDESAWIKAWNMYFLQTNLLLYLSVSFFFFEANFLLSECFLISHFILGTSIAVVMRYVIGNMGVDVTKWEVTQAVLLVIIHTFFVAESVIYSVIDAVFCWVFECR